MLEKVYVYGGGNTGSSSTDLYGPDFLIMADVLIVTFNFRYGPLGFMRFADKSLKVPGNAGLKDQKMALNFVKNNIHHFGGDPNNVTAFGHSFGAIFLEWHYLSDCSKGQIAINFNNLFL